MKSLSKVIVLSTSILAANAYAGGFDNSPFAALDPMPQSKEALMVGTPGDIDNSAPFTGLEPQPPSKEAHMSMEVSSQTLSNPKTSNYDNTHPLEPQYPSKEAQMR